MVVTSEYEYSAIINLYSFEECSYKEWGSINPMSKMSRVREFFLVLVFQVIMLINWGKKSLNRFAPAIQCSSCLSFQFVVADIQLKRGRRWRKKGKQIKRGPSQGTLSKIWRSILGHFYYSFFDLLLPLLCSD